MPEFSIKEIEILSGIKAHTIRIWEQRYTFLNPSRSKTNIRSYSLQQLQSILNISLLNNNGYKISGINKMQPQQIENAIADAIAPGNTALVLNKLFMCMYNLDMTGFENVLNEYILNNGIGQAVENIIDAFLQKIQQLYVDAYLKDEYRHLMSSIIRQKLTTAINNIQAAYADSKMIISFLPENHHNEIDLLYMQYLLKKNGLLMYYFGVNVPVKDIAMIAENKYPDYVHTHIDATAHNFNAVKFFRKLSQQFSDVKVLITGSGLQQFSNKAPKNIFIIPSVKEALRFIA